MQETETPGQKVNVKWLFMMYMVANDDQLDALAVQDLLEIERAVAKNENIAAVVQIQRRWPRGPQRYFIAHGRETELLAVDGEAVSPGMGSTKVLAGFLEDSVGRVAYPSVTRFCLVLWGHSYGLGFGRDHGDELRLGELRIALDAFKTQRKKPLDLLGANTCVMSYIEAMYELRESALYMVASQGFVPFAGWPYDRILPLVGADGPEIVGQTIVKQYVDFFNDPDRDERVSMTLADLKKVGPFADLLNDLGTAISGAVGGTPQLALATIRDAFLANPAGTTRPVLDLQSLSTDLKEAAEELKKSGNGPSTYASALDQLAQAAGKVVRELIGAKFYTRQHASLENFCGVGVFAPFVVDDGRIQRLLARERRRVSASRPPSTEMSRYASKKKFEASQPDDREEDFSRLREGRTKYEELAIFQSSRSKAEWPNLVFGALAPDEPEETVDVNGVVRPVERSAVNQMLFAVDASHRRLSRAIEAARILAKEELERWIRLGRGRPLKARQLLAHLGPPALRLTSLAAVIRRGQSTRIRKVDGRRPPLVDALKRLEDRLGQVERTVRRVVTDATLGIGPSPSPGGIGASFNEKSTDAGLNVKPADHGLLEKPLHQGLSDVIKSTDPGLGSPATPALGQISLGSKIVFASSNSELGSLATVELLGQVTRGLLLLERDVARIERDIAYYPANQLLLEAALPTDSFEAALKDRLDELFDLLEEDHVRAHMTIRWVLRHPTFGLGPGPLAIGRADRESFAAAAGFNRRQLRLLSQATHKLGS